MRTRRIAGLLAAGLLVQCSADLAAVPPITVPELQEHVEYLADPAREGRGLGTAGIDSAGAYIARWFEAYGLRPGGPDGGYFQPFEAKLKAGEVEIRNVVAILPGGENLPRPYIVLGAHYDHLGYGGEGRASEREGTVHPGADDNASGVAALMELAERFASGPALERTLVFVAFTGEERGLLGSAYFVDHATYPLEKTLLMLNLDAVGRPDPGEATLFGTETAAEFDSLLEEVNVEKLTLKRGDGGLGPSDHTSFLLKGIPALHFFGAAHLDYHRPTDTPEKLNYAGLRDIASLVARLVETAARTPAPLEFREPPPQATRVPAHGGKDVYLGIIPDFGGSERGMALRGVRRGSPAEHAGLREADVILRIEDSTIGGIEDLFHALQAHDPGDTVIVEILRGSERLALRAILGRREPPPEAETTTRLPSEPQP